MDCYKFCKIVPKCKSFTVIDDSFCWIKKERFGKYTGVSIDKIKFSLNMDCVEYVGKIVITAIQIPRQSTISLLSHI